MMLPGYSKRIKHSVYRITFHVKNATESSSMSLFLNSPAFSFLTTRLIYLFCMKTLCRRLITFIRGDKEQKGRCVGVSILNTMLGAATQVEKRRGQRRMCRQRSRLDRLHALLHCGRRQCALQENHPCPFVICKCIMGLLCQD